MFKKYSNEIIQSIRGAWIYNMRNTRHV